jgi:hypothetical protein
VTAPHIGLAESVGQPIVARAKGQHLDAHRAIRPTAAVEVEDFSTVRPHVAGVARADSLKGPFARARGLDRRPGCVLVALQDEALGRLVVGNCPDARTAR